MRGQARHLSWRQDREGDVSAQAGDSAYALLADGTTIEIRPGAG